VHPPSPDFRLSAFLQAVADANLGVYQTVLVIGLRRLVMRFFPISHGRPPLVKCRCPHLRQETSSANQAPRARENENLQNELLEAKHGERLDTRATGATSGNDPELATVGEIKRAKDSNR
jgi:hypothetical protein